VKLEASSNGNSTRSSFPSSLNPTNGELATLTNDCSTCLAQATAIVTSRSPGNDTLTISLTTRGELLTYRQLPSSVRQSTNYDATHFAKYSSRLRQANKPPL